MDTNTPTPRMQTITPATLDDVRPGDHITWEKTRVVRSVTATEIREGDAHHRNEDDAWCAKDGMWIAPCDGEGITITIRRPVQDVPTEPGTVLEPADGHEYITATFDGQVYRAREAILFVPDHWHAAWRSDEGVLPYVISERIDADTWKKGNR